jgi:hypothetical protein
MDDGFTVWNSDDPVSRNYVDRFEAIKECDRLHASDFEKRIAD